MNILESFRINHPVKLAAVGAGGKTSFLFALAREIPGKCIITTTTHISIEQSNRGDIRLLSNDLNLYKKIIAAPENATIIIVGTQQGRERVNGPDQAILAQLHTLCEQENLSLLVEADGSKKLPLKAFANHEPAVPEWIDIIVHIIGWNSIGKQVDDTNIFRVDRYCELTNQKKGDIINFSSIANLLLHEKGGKKAIKHNQRSIIFFNQCPNNLIIDQKTEAEIYSLLSFHHSVIFGNTPASNGHSSTIVNCFENIAAVILAAGGSSRLGENKIKQLLQYHGNSFLQNTANLILKGPFTKQIAVLGYKFELLQKELEGYSIEIINNSQWENGQSTSVIAAVNELIKSSHLGGAMFFPIDQPNLDLSTINQILQCHTNNIGSTIVPRYKDMVGAPVLFDRNHFANLLNLHGDKGGRAILYQVSHRFCDITNQLALQDIDTMDVYLKLIEQNH